MKRSTATKARCVRVSSHLRDFADIWPSIDAPLPNTHVFQTREYLSTWLQTIGAARRVKPYFVAIHDDAGPHMLVALGVEPRRGAKVLTFLDGGVSDYNAPIILRPTAQPESGLWRDIIAAIPNIDAIALDKMPSAIGTTPNPLCARANTAPPSAYALKLTGDWDTYQATRLHRPKDSRRKRRRLSEAGDVRLLVADNRTDALRIYSDFIAQKTRRYIEKNGVDGFERPGYRRYFGIMTQRMFPAHVHLSALEVNGELLATHWGLVYGKHFYCLMLAYADSPLAQYSPARLLVEDLIQWCYARGFETFDLGVGDAAWKAQLGAEAMPLAHTLRTLTPYGWAYERAKTLSQRVIRRPLPASPPHQGAHA